jgi:HSP20 family protein
MGRVQAREDERPASSLPRAMNRLHGWPAWPLVARRPGPPVDLTERPATLVVEVEIPGVAHDDVDVRVTGDVLILRCKRPARPEDEDTTRHLAERRHGAFVRTIALPTPVDARSATAVSKNGVLRITLPKHREPRSDRIEVECA